MSDKKVNSLHRAVEIAVELFLQKRFEDVSVREIAAAAHCSTETIYAAFGTKDNLFVQAIAYYDETLSIPRIPSSVGAKTLYPILGFALARIRLLASPRFRAALHAVIARGETLEVVQSSTERRYQQIFDIALEVETCIAAKLLIAHDPSVIAYNIFSGVAYEPMSFGHIYRDTKPIHVGNIIKNVFTPLVKKKGRAQLETFLSTIAEDVIATSDERPYHVSDHRSDGQASMVKKWVSQDSPGATFTEQSRRESRIQ